MKQLISLTIVLVFLIGLVGCAPAQPEVIVITATPGPVEKVIRIGQSVSGGPPFAYYTDGDPNKPLIGLEPDMINEIGECMGARVEWYDVNWTGIFTGLLAGKWDIASGQIFATQERDASMDFADPYMEADTGVMIKKGAQLKSLEDMKGKVLGADTGSAAIEWLQDNVDKYGPYEIKTYDTLSEVWLDVEAGRIDGGLGDAPGIVFYVKDYPNLELGFELGEGYMQASAFRPGDPLMEEYNKCQRELKKSGRLAEIYETYFGAPPEPDSVVNKLFDDAPYVPDK